MYNKALYIAFRQQNSERGQTIMSEYSLRAMEEKDREAVLEMMRGFYASDAVNSNGSEEIFNNDVDECISDSPFASGFVFETAEGSICGYAMLAHSYGTEFGRKVVWIEDLYLDEEARGNGLADMLFDFVRDRYPDSVHRLEVEEFNFRAVRSYKKNGFTTLPYTEMLRSPEKGGEAEQ